MFPNSGERLQLDVFIPSLSVAFEYQGHYHYKEWDYDNLQDTQYKDSLKRQTYSVLFECDIFPGGYVRRRALHSSAFHFGGTLKPVV